MVAEPALMGWSIRIEMVDLDVIIVPKFQRPLSPLKAEEIAKDFDPIAVGLLILSVRQNGETVIIDGLSRLAAMRTLGFKQARCQVFEGLSIEQESIAFEHCNQRRVALAARDRFRSRLARSEPLAMAIRAALESEGFVTDLSTLPTGSSPSVRCFEALDYVFKKHGLERLTSVLSIARSAWPEMHGRDLSSVLVKALAEEAQFICESRTVRVRRLGKREARELITEARRRAVPVRKNPRAVLRSLIHEIVSN